MKANLHAGEIGIAIEGRDYIFRPSFYALAQIGDEYDLVDIYNRMAYAGFNELANALNIITACFVNEDKTGLLDLIGYFKDVKGKLRYKIGVIPLEPKQVLGNLEAPNTS